jgi:hypothetical protein
MHDSVSQNLPARSSSDDCIEVTMSDTTQTEVAPTEPLRPPAGRSAKSYALSSRERRRRHRWWLLALLISIVVGLVTLALAQDRGDESSSSPALSHVTAPAFDW